MLYTPPTTSDLTQLKTQLGLTGKGMAELFGLSGDQQWRKYTGGHDPRQMSAQMLFFAMARLELDEKAMNRILERMRQAGAIIDFSGPSNEGPRNIISRHGRDGVQWLLRQWGRFEVDCVG